MKIYIVLIYIQILKFSGYSIMPPGIKHSGRWSMEKAEWKTQGPFAGIHHHQFSFALSPFSSPFSHFMKSLPSMLGKTENWSLILILFILSLKQGFRKSKLFFFSRFSAFSSLEVISTKWEVINAWTWSKELQRKEKNSILRGYELGNGFVNMTEVPWVTYSLIKSPILPGPKNLQHIWMSLVRSISVR